MTTIFRFVQDHIGQVKVEDANKEIQRLEKETKKKWKMDFSEYLTDDDEDFPHPMELSRGHCWVVRDFSKEEKEHGFQSVHP